MNGQELASLPGLLAVTPPRRSARGREHDNLIVYFMLAGNTPFSIEELRQLMDSAAKLFHQLPGSLTSAMRKAAESINTTLLESNLASAGRGQHVLGLVVLAVIRHNQCTLLLSGPTHAVWVSEGQSRHIHDPALSGKGLGSGQTIQAYFSREPYHSWREKGFVRVMMQTGRTRDPRLPDVPTLDELMNEYKTAGGPRRLAALALAATDFGRPIVAPPGLAADKSKLLRDAFMKTMKDPELLAEAKNKNFDITPSGGEELEALAKEVVRQPPEVVEQVQKLLGQ